MTPRDIHRRLERLEQQQAAKRSAPRVVRRFVVQGPIGFDTDAFLRSRGHDLDTPDLCIIMRIVGCENSQEVDLPLADLTDKYGE